MVDKTIRSVYNKNMKIIRQKQIAKHLGVSEAFISDIRKGNKMLGRLRAKSISTKSGISFEMLMLERGEKLYQLLEKAYKSNK